MNTKKLIIGLGIIAASAYTPLTVAKDILTSTPVTYMLSQQLMQGTGLKPVTYHQSDMALSV